MHLDVTTRGELMTFSGPLPAYVVQAALVLGAHSKSSHQRRACAGLVLAFLMFNRPGTAAAAVRAEDL